MNKKVNELKRLKNRVLAGLLATTMLVSMSGCSKNREDSAPRDVGFLVEGTSNVCNDCNGLYSYIINRNGLESAYYDFSSSSRDVSLAKVVKKEVYNRKCNNQTSKFYKDNMKLLLPDNYARYGLSISDSSWFNASNFDFEFILEEVEELNGCSYTICYSNATATRDLVSADDGLIARQYFINKGDSFSSVAIYFRGELVGFKQSGVGSNSNNIINATVGDMDLALSTLEEQQLLSDTMKVNYDELCEYQDCLNEKSKSLKK